MKWWTPRPYQPIMTAFMLRVRRCCLFVPMGFGKTSAVLLVIQALLLAGMARKILVLAPLRVARTTWPEESRKWTQFVDITIRPIIGSAADRKAVLAEIRQHDVFTINYDNLIWLMELLGDKWPFDVVIADESTRLKSFRTKQGGKRAQALSTVAHKRVRRWINLTGTPVPNGLQDLWGQMWFIDEGTRLGRTYSAFEERWFGFQRKKDAVNPSKFYVKRIVFPHAEAEIHELLKDVCLTLDPKDWFDLEEPIVNTLYIDLPPQARVHYREMEKQMFTVLEENEIEAFGAAAKTIKCLQLASGAAYINGSNEEWVEVHDEKIQALESIVEEAAGAPVLVAYHFRSDLARLHRAFPSARRLDANPDTIRAWNAGEIPILLAHPASAGHGISLQDGGNILVFFSWWWALEEHQQIIERIGPVRQKQSGHDRPVFIYNIVARDTVDELVVERLQSKKSVQDVLLKALKNYHETEVQP